MIEVGHWQPVPGAPGVDVFPIVPPPSIVNSSSWLLRAPDALVVIDPGGSAAQIAGINALLRVERRAAPRPTFVLLTHCHLDHSFEAPHLEGEDVFACAEASGAEALERADRLLTAAFLWDELEVGPMAVPVRLFSPRDFRPDGIATLALPNGHRLSVHADLLRLTDATALRRQRVSIGGGNWLDVVHTPGHSPCSVTPCCGDLVFTGDLHLAANPGICGLPGWSQSDLVSSIDAIDGLLRDRPSGICCPGHGGPMSARTMQRILRQARSEALELADIDAIDSRRMRMLTSHTHEFIEEAWHLFTAISGRLYALAYHLEELQEFEAARRYLALLDMERIDEALSAFRRFRQSFDAAEQPEMVLVMKGVETSRRIQRLFAAPKLAEVIEPSLLQRADRVLTDLLSSVRGLRFASGAEAVDVNAVISGIADRFGSFRVDDQAMLDAVDDPDRYVAALASRLSVPLAYRGVRWDCTLASGLPPADVQRERLGDIVTSVAEDLVSAGAREIHAATGFARGSIAITLQAPGIRAPGAMEDSRIALFDRTLATVGGALERLPVAGASVGVALRLPVS